MNRYEVHIQMQHKECSSFNSFCLSLIFMSLSNTLQRLSHKGKYEYSKPYPDTIPQGGTKRSTSSFDALCSF